MKYILKINKVIAFKQKSESDDVRQKAMDKHLVFLVKQTERYTNMLSHNLTTGGTIGLELSRKKRKNQINYWWSSSNCRCATFL